MLKKAILLTLLLTCGAAMGQKALVVHLPATGKYVVFCSHGAPTEAPTDTKSVVNGDVTVNSQPTDDEISVWDQISGNIGSKAISSLAAGWQVSPADLDHVAQADVLVQHNGSAVAAAQVDLEDGAKRQPEIIDPESAGKGTFFNVKPGRLIATVRVKGSQPISQIFTLTLDRPEARPKFTVSVASAVDAPATAAAGTTAGHSAPGAPATPPAAAPSPIGTAVTYLLAIAVAVGVGYGAIQYFNKDPGTISEKLEQLGVHIPKPDDQGAAGGAPVPFDPQPKPAPPQKILLDDSAPIPLSTPVSVPMSPGINLGMVSSEPSLLTDAGVAIPLSEGENIVGRDPGLGLSLTGESSVSRKHATLVRQGKDVTVSDLGSTNGTFLNGAKIQAPTVLRPGDSVQFGSVAFRYQG